MKKFVIVIVIVIVTAACSSLRQVQVVREVSRDTLYLSNVQYDSIYVYQDHLTDRSRDTVLIRETNTIYKYQMLRDTIERVKIETVHDSIPYEVKIIETKDVPRPLTWFDHLTRACFWVLIGVIFVLFVRFVFNLKSKSRL